MLVDINVGMDRTGVATRARRRWSWRAGSIARRASGSPGIMGYEGHMLTAWPNEEKLRQTAEAIAGLVESRRAHRGRRHPGRDRQRRRLRQLTCSRPSLDGLTELQAGGACFMDPFYGELCHLEELGFEYALTILTTVTSRPTPERVITDAGFKTLSAKEEWHAVVLGHDDFELVYLSAEHGVWLRKAEVRRSGSASSSRSSPTTTTRRPSGTTPSSACVTASSRRSSRSSPAAG